MMNRKQLAFGALVVLIGLAGCSSVLGPGNPNPDKINRNVSYDWNTSANATIEINRTEYRAVYVVSNKSAIEFYSRDALGTENKLKMEGVKFQYPNGTVTNLSVKNITYKRKKTVIDPPVRDGKIAFTAARTGKDFSTPRFVDGSYEVTLPENARVGVPLLAQVTPGNYTVEQTGSKITLRWENVDSRAISVRYYLQRDILLFGGLSGILLLTGALGAVYYLRQIRELEQEREEVGLDIDIEDDEFDDGPPPGMG